ncbi:MAG TPA: phosphate ABC transporter substrate-binding protein PstS, partial [Candidatus Thermoplasmatota archaeon]|nr:phosphate ABC transporter substrate-binding protein PstS [Candidatus Thermoplasmatota archaeon]
MRNLIPITIACIAALLVAGCSGPTSSGGSGTDNGVPVITDSEGTPVTYPPNPFAPPSSTTQVFGSGATFPKPLVESWGLEYHNRVESSVQVSYAGGGSGKGISDVTKKDVLFAGSDAPMSVNEKAAASGILHFPETLGVIAVVYNVAGVPDGLKLDGETIGKIYAGTIKKWNDPAITALNPGVSLPDNSIAVARRSDSSGTTFAYTDFLAKTSPTWSAKVASSATKMPDWTKSSATLLADNGNDGVAGRVKQTPNSIGYVELAYVKSQGLKAAQVKSHDGEFLAPSTEGGSKAAAGASSGLPAPDGDWSRVSIADASGAGAYPISTFSYILVYDSTAAYGSRLSGVDNQMAAFKAWMW